MRYTLAALAALVGAVWALDRWATRWVGNAVQEGLRPDTDDTAETYEWGEDAVTTGLWD